MKYIATVALMFSLGVAGVYAQERPVKMTFSGTVGPSPINLQQPNTQNSEENYAGNGTLGAFTFRNISAETSSPQPSSACSGPTRLYFVRVAGAGVFRFQDGSLLIVTVKDGSGCIDLAAGNAALIVNYQITGGTGRLTGASGYLTLTATLVSVLFNASGGVVLATDTGKVEGTVFGVNIDTEGRDDRQ